jgi:hypothetical protein
MVSLCLDDTNPFGLNESFSVHLLHCSVVPGCYGTMLVSDGKLNLNGNLETDIGSGACGPCGPHQ